MARGDARAGAQTGKARSEYELMLLLDRLESLREDLAALESGESGDEDAPVDPDELRAEMDELGIGSLDELDRRIAELHRTLDER